MSECLHENVRIEPCDPPHNIKRVCAGCAAFVGWGDGTPRPRVNNGKWLRRHREIAFERGEGLQCSMCKIPEALCATGFELHHRTPLFRGGKDAFENTVPMCYECHRMISTRQEVARRVIARSGEAR